MKKFMNFIAYVAIMFVAIAITIGHIWSDISVLRNIAEIIAYAITAVSAFYYARSKQHPAYMICYVVAVVLIIVMLVLGII